eukprot:5011926-Prymnesium_polylepis.1
MHDSDHRQCAGVAIRSTVFSSALKPVAQATLFAASMWSSRTRGTPPRSLNVMRTTANRDARALGVSLRGARAGEWLDDLTLPRILIDAARLDACDGRLLREPLD